MLRDYGLATKRLPVNSDVSCPNWQKQRIEILKQSGIQLGRDYLRRLWKELLRSGIRPPGLYFRLMLRARHCESTQGLLLSVRNDLASARPLLTEAKGIFPETNFRPLESIFVLQEQGAEAAFQFLDSPKTVDEWNLQLQLLLNLGRLEDLRSCWRRRPWRFRRMLTRHGSKAFVFYWTAK